MTHVTSYVIHNMYDDEVIKREKRKERKIVSFNVNKYININIYVL